MEFNLEDVDVDGAVRESADAVSGDTRLSFLKKGALTGGAALSGGAILSALTAGTAMAASGDRQRPPATLGSLKLGTGDVGILNYALLLEYLESTFYNDAAKMNIAKGDAPLTHYLKTAQHDENAQVAALKGGLKSAAIPKPSFDFSKYLSSKKTFAETAFVLENTGVHAYHGQITNIKSAAYLVVAAEIATVEGRHAGAIAQYLGGEIAPKSAFDSPLGAGTVVKAVEGLKVITKL